MNQSDNGGSPTSRCSSHSIAEKKMVLKHAAIVDSERLQIVQLS